MIESTNPRKAAMKEAEVAAERQQGAPVPVSSNYQSLASSAPGDMGVPPPAYRPIPVQNASGGPNPPPNPSDTTPLNAYYLVPVPQPQRSPRRRFLRGLAIAIVILFLFHSVTHMIRYSFSATPWGTPVSPDPVKDGKVISDDDCAPSWSSDVALTEERQISTSDRPYPPGVYPSYRYHYQARYNLPASLKDVYFLTRGSYQGGSFRYELAPEDASDIVVNVDMYYWEQDAKDSTNLCVLHKSSTHKGFGIFTPWQGPHENHRSIHFEVVVRIPKSAFDTLGSLASDLHNYSQYVGSFKHTWNKIDLVSTNGGIFAEGRLRSPQLAFHTSNAPIEGHFFSDHELTLQTSNGHIKADVELLSKSNPVTAKLLTTNARVESSLSLATVDEDDKKYPGKEGDFDVEVKTSNSPVDLRVPVAPIGHKLRLSSRTSNSRSVAKIFRSFEGAFRLHTSNAPFTVHKDVTSDHDPAGKGRKPTLQVNIQKRDASGKFYWGDEEVHSSSEVEITTSNGPVDLAFI
ncbi:hypothetical protein DL93DRAFT_2073514 [Clavulina sp. PMI_390]|nr:hypothetical protein DL93DRAFT_2073514 [Clavulina sp. PMI_390]